MLYFRGSPPTKEEAVADMPDGTGRRLFRPRAKAYNDSNIRIPVSEIILVCNCNPKLLDSISRKP